MKATSSPVDLDRFGRLAGVLRRPARARSATSRCRARAVAPASTRGAGRVGVQEIERRGGDRVLHVASTAAPPRATVGVEIVLADQHAAAGVVENLHELPLAQHRIARHDDGAALPGGEHGDRAPAGCSAGTSRCDRRARCRAAAGRRPGRPTSRRADRRSATDRSSAPAAHRLPALQGGPEHVQRGGARRLDGSSHHDNLTLFHSFNHRSHPLVSSRTHAGKHGRVQAQRYRTSLAEVRRMSVA